MLLITLTVLQGLNSIKTNQLMHLRTSSFQLILYACVFKLKNHMVLYSEYTRPNYKTMVFYSAPLLCLREGHFFEKNPWSYTQENRYLTRGFHSEASNPAPITTELHYSFDPCLHIFRQISRGCRFNSTGYFRIGSVMFLDNSSN